MERGMGFFEKANILCMRELKREWTRSLVAREGGRDSWYYDFKMIAAKF